MRNARVAGFAGVHPPRQSWHLTVALQVLVEEQAVVHGDEAEAGVVALVGDVAGGQTWVGHQPGQGADTPGPLEGLNVPGQAQAFTLKKRKNMGHRNYD